MFLTIGVVAGVLLAALLVYAATRPNTFLVKRTQTIQSPPPRVFDLIADLHSWALWSPFEKLDPTMKKTFSGATSGKGAVTTWSGNSKAGEGRMEILEAVSPSRIQIKLDIVKPFEGHNTAEFSLQTRNGYTEVTWAMYGPQPYMLKLMSIFAGMDKMLGKEFEDGLASLKAVAESKQSFSTKGA